jgi:hypothetical protein
MMLSLLVYAYSIAECSSRRIEHDGGGGDDDLFGLGETVGDGGG